METCLPFVAPPKKIFNVCYPQISIASCWVVNTQLTKKYDQVKLASSSPRINNVQTSFCSHHLSHKKIRLWHSMKFWLVSDGILIWWLIINPSRTYIAWTNIFSFTAHCWPLTYKFVDAQLLLELFFPLYKCNFCEWRFTLDVRHRCENHAACVWLLMMLFLNPRLNKMPLNIDNGEGTFHESFALLVFQNLQQEHDLDNCFGWWLYLIGSMYGTYACVWLIFLRNI